jgi:hypothetical protein
MVTSGMLIRATKSMPNHVIALGAAHFRLDRSPGEISLNSHIRYAELTENRIRTRGETSHLDLLVRPSSPQLAAQG